MDSSLLDHQTTRNALYSTNYTTSSAPYIHTTYIMYCAKRCVLLCYSECAHPISSNQPCTGYQTSLTGHSERAIDVEVPRRSSVKANSGAGNGAKVGGVAAAAAESKPSSNAEDLYSKPDMAKKKMKMMTVVKKEESEKNARDSATDSSSGSFAMSGTDSSPSVSMWNVQDDNRPSSVA